LRGNRRTVDVDHKLLVGWANGGVESAPRLQTAAKRDGALARREEEAVPPNHDTTSRAVGVRSKDNVKGREKRKDVVVAVLRVAIEVARRGLGRPSRIKNGAPCEGLRVQRLRIGDHQCVLFVLSRSGRRWILIFVVERDTYDKWPPRVSFIMKLLGSDELCGMVMGYSAFQSLRV
jgi:hypothetical protein